VLFYDVAGVAGTLLLTQIVFASRSSFNRTQVLFQIVLLAAALRLTALYVSLGLIGMGRIGQAVARRARAFGLQIHYHNRRPVAEEIAAELEATYWESLDQMLAHMDIISVNCPHTPATFHLLSARRLALLKSDAYIVNTARGEVIDENALARIIEEGRIAGAGLDVFEHEPAVNPKLLNSERVVVLPHMGSATIEGRVDMGEKVIINIRTFLDGHAPPDRVHAAML
jgi:glyoxylate reductase